LFQMPVFSSLPFNAGGRHCFFVLRRLWDCGLTAFTLLFVRSNFQYVGDAAVSHAGLYARFVRIAAVHSMYEGDIMKSIIIFFSAAVLFLGCQSNPFEGLTSRSIPSGSYSGTYAYTRGSESIGSTAQFMFHGDSFECRAANVSKGYQVYVLNSAGSFSTDGSTITFVDTGIHIVSAPRLYLWLEGTYTLSANGENFWLAQRIDSTKYSMTFDLKREE
jgi:hypothetical protein